MEQTYYVLHLEQCAMNNDEQGRSEMFQVRLKNSARFLTNRFDRTSFDKSNATFLFLSHRMGKMKTESNLMRSYSSLEM